MHGELTRRSFLAGTAASVTGGAMAADGPGPGSLPQAAGDPSARPNILWICTDQQRYDTIGGLATLTSARPISTGSSTRAWPLPMPIANRRSARPAGPAS